MKISLKTLAAARHRALPLVGSLTVAVFAASATPPPLVGQDLCLPAPDSHEANAFATLSVPMTFTAAVAPTHRMHGLSIGLEAATLPQVSRVDATPTACRPDKGPENTNPIPGIIRPRLAVAWHGFSVEVSWIPPVRVAKVKANLFGLAITHKHPIGANWTLALRADAELGSLRAPVTCDDEDLRDAASDCFGGTRSDDRWNPNVFGFEAAIGARATHRLRPYLGAGLTLLHPRFEVNFTNAADSTDHRRIEVNLRRIAVFGGVTGSLDQSGRSTVTAEAYATPGDAVAFRLVLRKEM